jgi:hypothetical protein
MKEDFLHYLWKYQLFDISNLKTTQNESISILKPGAHNLNSGPDFLNAKIDIENQLWFGNVEIHLKSSDWYLHQHETDKNYDAVILHVVWEYDTDVFIKDNTPIATLELKNIVSKNVLNNYQKLSSKNTQWIPCEKELHTIDSFLLNNWLERLYIERLEDKSKSIAFLLKASKNDWEAVLFQLLAKNFGLKENGDSFLKLAKSIPFSIIRKERNDLTKLSALLFGQAGFLSENIESSYHTELRKEYEYLQHKYQLTPLSKHEFQFFRMRPSNFPTVRIAQLIALYHQHQNLFSTVINLETIENLYMLFTIEVSEFWNSHFTFEKTSKITKKKFTNLFLDLIFINTIIPLQFTYQKTTNSIDEERLFEKMKGLKPEKNSIILKFSELKIETKNAFESQALLELKNNYCASKRCLECAIGNKLLRS